MILWIDMTKDERLAVISEGLALNLSFSQIAAPFGCTRHAVIGFAHRNGLRSSHVRAAASYRPKAERQRPPAKQPTRPKPRLAPIIALLSTPTAPPPAPESLRVPILLRKMSQCPWVDGRGDDGLATVCGHAIEPGANWCHFHRLKVWRGA